MEDALDWALNNVYMYEHMICLYGLFKILLTKTTTKIFLLIWEL